MKRVLTLAVPCLAAVMLLYSASSFAQTQAKVASTVSIKATPKTDRKTPRVFKLTGKMTPASRPRVCGPGVTNPAYCSPATIAQLCSGKVRVVIKKGVRVVARKTVSLSRTKCTYSARITIPKKQRRATLRVSVRSLGNALVKPKSSKTVSIKV